MPPLLTLLAQQAEGEPFWAPLLHGPTRVFGHDWQQPPVVAIPVVLGVLALTSFVVERVAAWFVGGIASRTETKVDDVFAAGLPAIVRLTLVFVAIHVTVQAFVAHDARAAAGDAARNAAENAATAASVVVALSIVAVGVAVTRLSVRMANAWAEAKPHRRPVAPGIKLGLKVAAIPLIVVLALHAAGVQPAQIAPVLTVLGVGSLAVALALQDVLKNVFSGIQLVMDQPIRAGDFIVVDDGRVRGTVLEIGLRSTKLRTAENNVAILPNTILANAIVTNMDMIERAYAHGIRVTVATGSDARRVQAVLQEEADRAAKEVPGLLDESGKVHFVEMADAGLVFRVTVRLQQYLNAGDPASELNHRIYERLRREGIEIPVPARAVTVKQGTPPSP